MDPAQPGDGAPPAPAQAPTCYRHPDRETYVRCGRCDRPICPDCMIPASVGFQCPDCVREGNKSVRPARTLAGGQVPTNPGWVTKIILAVTVGFFVLQQVPELPVERHLELLGYWPGPDPTGVAAGEVWRLLTVALVHAGFLHIALNGYGIWVVGPEIEAAFGRLRFVLLYVVSALGGGTASYALNNVVGSSVGASGALFGLFGALIVVSRRLRRDTGPLYVLLAINLGAGFLLPLIDWRGHLGGLVTGYAVAWILVHAPRGRRVLVQSVGVALVVAVLVGVVAARTAQIQQRAEDCRPAFTSAEAATQCLNEGP